MHHTVTLHFESVSRGVGEWVCVHKAHTLTLSFLTCCDLAATAITSYRWYEQHKPGLPEQNVLCVLCLVGPRENSQITPSDNLPSSSPHTDNPTQPSRFLIHNIGLIRSFLCKKAAQVLVQPHFWQVFPCMPPDPCNQSRMQLCSLFSLKETHSFTKYLTLD